MQLVVACLSWTIPARADVVTDWNAVIVRYVSGDPAAVPPIPTGRGGPPGLLDIALVHLAMHDAVQAAAEEVVDARIILGIHFRSADDQARRLGQRIALWTIIHELGPTRHHHGKGH